MTISVTQFINAKACAARFSTVAAISLLLPCLAAAAVRLPQEIGNYATALGGARGNAQGAAQATGKAAPSSSGQSSGGTAAPNTGNGSVSSSGNSSGKKGG